MKDRRLFYVQRRFMFDSLLGHISTSIDPIGINNMIRDLEFLFLKHGNVLRVNYLKSVPESVQDIARKSVDIDLLDYQREIVSVLFNCSYASTSRAMSAKWKYSVHSTLAMAKRCLAVVLLNDSQIREIRDSNIMVL